MTFFLHIHDPSDDLPSGQVEIADCCMGVPGGKMATITANEPQAKPKPSWDKHGVSVWDDSAADEQRLRLLRKLVDDANAYALLTKLTTNPSPDDRLAADVAGARWFQENESGNVLTVLLPDGTQRYENGHTAPHTPTAWMAYYHEITAAEAAAHFARVEAMHQAVDAAPVESEPKAGETYPIYTMSGTQLVIEYGPQDKRCVFEYAVGEPGDWWGSFEARVSAAEAHAFIEKWHGKAKADELVPLPLPKPTPVETQTVSDDAAGDTYLSDAARLSDEDSEAADFRRQEYRDRQDMADRHRDEMDRHAHS